MDLSPTLDLRDALSPLDGVVFASVLALTVAAVVWGQRRRGSLDADASLIDYLIMGRRLSWPMFTATLVATWYGGIFGVTELAFQEGIWNFLTQGVFWYVTYLLFAFLLVPRLAPYQALTLPDLVGRMFGPRSSRVAAVFNLLNVVPVAYAISIGLLGQMMFGGPLWLNMAGGTALVCLYDMAGGLRAVVFSDLVQFFVMVIAVALVVAFAWAQLGGMSYLTAHLPASHFDPTGKASWGRTLAWGLIALSTLVDPNFYQRCFAAESPGAARRGIVAATVVWCLFDVCTTLGGMYAAAAIPAADSRHAYLLFSVQVLPAGLRGLFVAGIAATILSTLDSYVFVAGNTLSYDLAPEGLRRSVWLRRASVVAVGGVAVALGSAFEGSIRDVWLLLGSYSAGCLLIPMMAGHLWPGRIGDGAFVAATLAGAGAITAWRFIPREGLWAEVDGLYIGCLATGVVLWAGARLLRGISKV